MGIGEHFVILECQCGHSSTSWLADWPEHTRTHWGVRDEAMARLRCSVCGRVGRPAEVRFGWSAGPKPGREHVRGG
ncbi:hypothetical protein CG51_10710 [Haematobacter missouriensis]|uniref:Uncharacterized protein n=1 Tax=Haematobacter missouriensis TaxID=366616 RepID=A0A212AY39_9RHOB|nr:hypothetical protein CG51_10710 [Haematobacter missouriensis]OWJ77586.1 hypothetical protein CDV53_05740 [Haematobacter missouriensis]OWJ86389.1 hypothetical protein CDV52_00015 [Haematobacter missouriensis]